MPSLHLLINALSTSFGGGLVVTRELARHLALVRPDWSITLLVTTGKPAHGQLRSDLAGTTIRFAEAPTSTASVARRWLWENRALGPLVRSVCADVVFQPNGMVPRGIDAPVFAHIGDPWPYLDVRDRWFDPAIAVLRRRGHRRATLHARAMGFTSHFVMGLVHDRFGTLPERSDVYYNGLPAAWRDRPRETIVPIERRERSIVTVSLVSPYKGQAAVIKALPLVRQMTGLRDLRYRIIGQCSPAYREELMHLATLHGVEDGVSIEGRVEQSVVEQAYATARCFALPSLSESFGLPSIEAMSFGTPVVVARAGATPEICADAAEYSDPADPASLAEALARVVGDERRSVDLQKRGLDNVQRFDWRATAQKLATTLEGLPRPKLAE